MAQLPDADRARIWRGFMRYLSERREVLAINKTQVRDAVDATDTWIDDNQVSFNQALPQAARDNLTQEQKTLLFCAVALMRVDVAVLRRVFGEVD